MTEEQLQQIEQARRYADQDEYVVTRTHIRNLLAIIDTIPNLACKSVQKRLASQWRQALLTGAKTIKAVRFDENPVPDVTHE